nr:2836_t:CDS:2 [Entrophospora candida]
MSQQLSQQNGQHSQQQQQNYYYDGQFQRPQQVYARQQLQRINDSNQQTLIQNLDQGIIVFDNLLPFQKMTNDGNNNNFLASSPSLINNPNFNNDHNLNLNVSSFNYGSIHMSNNEDPLIAAISHHMLMIKECRTKLDQHYFELEQNFKRLRSRDN